MGRLASFRWRVKSGEEYHDRTENNGLPDFLGINKGHIQKGYDADIVIFDPEGIECVFVNGKMRLKHGTIL